MNLLVPIDLSDAVPRVIAQATLLNSGRAGRIWLLHVVAPDPDFVGYDVGPQYIRDTVAHHVHEEHRQLQAWAEQVRAQGADCVALLVQGPTVATILHEADRLGVDCIVLGSHGKGAVHRLLVGSTSEGVLRETRVPVMIVPTHERRKDA